MKYFLDDKKFAALGNELNKSANAFPQMRLRSLLFVNVFEGLSILSDGGLSKLESFSSMHFYLSNVDFLPQGELYS